MKTFESVDYSTLHMTRNILESAI